MGPVPINYTQNDADDYTDNLKLSTARYSLQLMGMSQKFSRILHEWSVAGQGGYLEYFIPSLAHAKNLTSVGVEVDQYNGERWAALLFQYAESLHILREMSTFEHWSSGREHCG